MKRCGECDYGDHSTSALKIQFKDAIMKKHYEVKKFARRVIRYGLTVLQIIKLIIDLLSLIG